MAFDLSQMFGGVFGQAPQAPVAEASNTGYQDALLASGFSAQDAALMNSVRGQAPQGLSSTLAASINPANAPGSMWQMNNGAPAQQEGLKAPVFSAAGLTSLGNGAVGVGAGADQGLSTTLNAAGAGNIVQGWRAFGGNEKNLLGLANQFGVDPYSGDLKANLDEKLKDYYMINGLSGGWNPTGDARQASGVLYKKDENGMLQPIQQQDYHAREKGNWVQEHPGILAPLAVATAGIAAGAMGGNAAASGAAASSGSAAAGTGAAAGGAAGTGASTGWLGSLANYAGYGSQFGALPGYAQAGLQGALQGAATSGLTGGNPLMGALTGGITGGITPGVNSAYSGLADLPKWATNSLGSATVGGIGSALSGGNPLMGALGGGVSSGVGGALGANGINPQVASILGRLSGQSATALASGRDLSSMFTPQQIAMLVANPRTLQALFRG